MPQTTPHNFHIPVMGLAFSIDSPLKVARFGISSVVSLSDDSLLEQMRQHYSQQYGRPFIPITEKAEDYRARRVTAYLNLLDELVTQQVLKLQQQDFTPDSELTQYFEMLPDSSPLKQKYLEMRQTKDPYWKQSLQEELCDEVVPGSIDVNIMTKLDKTNYDKSGEPLPQEYSDALAALRGFANSSVQSSVVFSAGMNMRLYGYLENFSCFYPNVAGHFEKKVIIKVSDYRSAMVQGKILAKKGIWVSEFRIESGLNCGGHAFATDGYLIGPILEEFKQNREALRLELYSLFSSALAAKNIHVPLHVPPQRLTVQGGIGTADEQDFLMEHYGADGTGWGTPFLLVPEATTVDEPTLQQLVAAKAEDLFLSPISPLGVPFNSLRNTSNELLKMERAEKGKPGSPCVKKHLVSSTEFTSEPICTASSRYQRHKLKQLQAQELDPVTYMSEVTKVLAKECLCEGLANSAAQLYNISKKAATKAISICPGPNLAYFSGVFKLQEMVDHIYGKFNALNNTYRPHMFVNELNMYVDYWKKKKEEQLDTLTDKQYKYLQSFWDNLLQGIQYYKQMLPAIFKDELERQVIMLDELLEAEDQLQLARLEVAVQ
ncbi:nitronate monooxygenase family protein [Pontibacter cellulosilyticus]|uniref:Uncharacterized protein n=1 Tax=Pontibacter cellulosilyticus TaxID=1720253 RepID=A0A923NAU2_9BACT|nr:hypothetical protein [Pontibacter cellulosilyticus]MBC5994516.1 hypothetical protein [Pontibacter cellulosilyticus]